MSGGNIIQLGARRPRQLVDNTGRKIKIGQLVHIPMNGMFAGVLVDIKENAIEIPGRAPMNRSTVIIQVILRFDAHPETGMVGNCYIIAQPEEAIGPHESGVVVD